MSNWIGSARSNYVQFRDIEGLKEAIKRHKLPINLVESRDYPDYYALLVNEDSDDGGWPPIYPLDGDGKVDYDSEPVLTFQDFIVEFLPPDEVLIILEIGSESLRYLTGWAQAIRRTDDGTETIDVNLFDIYGLVRLNWGITPTEAER